MEGLMDGEKTTTHEDGSVWQSLYNDAVFELNPIALLQKIEAAQRVIADRLKDMGNPIDAHERELIEEAQQNLYFLRKHPAA